VREGIGARPSRLEGSDPSWRDARARDTRRLGPAGESLTTPKTSGHPPDAVARPAAVRRRVARIDRAPAAPSPPHEAFERPPVGRAWRLTVEQRLAVVRYAETVGIKPASARFGLDRNTVRAWRARWRAEGLGGLVPRSPRRPRPTPGG
jgi:hypothetical protein